jgi:hypothetical protein
VLIAVRRKAVKAKKKPSSAKRTPSKPARAAKAASVRLRSAQDPYRGPSPTRIEQSLDKGTSISLNDFRSIIKWS